MGKYKEHPKYNVLSIRVTDDEKAQYDEMKRRTNKNISKLMREAMHRYIPYAENAANQN